MGLCQARLCGVTHGWASPAQWVITGAQSCSSRPSRSVQPLSGAGVGVHCVHIGQSKAQLEACWFEMMYTLFGFVGRTHGWTLNPKPWLKGHHRGAVSLQHALPNHVSKVSTNTNGLKD